MSSPRVPAGASADEPRLDQTHFDHVLLGTGLTNAVLSSALAKADRSVLHLDPAGEYGTHMATHNLTSFVEFIQAHQQAWQLRPNAPRKPSDEQVAQWRQWAAESVAAAPAAAASGAAGDATAASAAGAATATSATAAVTLDVDQLEFDPVEHHAPFFEATFKDLALEKAQADAKKAAEAAATAAAAEAAAVFAAPAAVPPSSEGVSSAAAPADAAASAPAASSKVSLPSTVAKQAAEEVVSPLQSVARRFSIDISPHLLFSRSPLIDVLVASGIHHYVEFKAVDNAYFAPAAANNAAAAIAPPALTSLPLSKSAIFQSTTLSMLEKRQLMKFLHLALDDDYYHSKPPEVKPVVNSSVAVATAPSDSAQVSSSAAAPSHPALTAAQAAEPFLTFLSSQKLSPQLTQMVLFAVALVDEGVGAGSMRTLTAAEGLQRLRAYLSSVGRYGPGAFLYPNYGTSELAQAFARLAAVNKTIFILRCQPAATVWTTADKAETAAAASADTPQQKRRCYHGILTRGGQLITSSSLIAEADFHIDADGSAEQQAMTSATSAATDASSDETAHFVTRCVLITDGELSSAVAGVSLANSSFFSVAPPASSAAASSSSSSSSSLSPLYGLQLGVEVSAAPRGHHVVYLFAMARGIAQARVNRDRLLALAEHITRPLGEAGADATKGSKPHLLAVASYQQQIFDATLPVLSTEEIAAAIAAAAAAKTKAAAAADAAKAASVAKKESADASVVALQSAADAADDADISHDGSDAPPPPPLPLPSPLSGRGLLSPSPSGTIALSLDDCLLTAQRLFAALYPSLDFHDTMRATAPAEHTDEDMALLQSLDKPTAAGSNSVASSSSLPTDDDEASSSQQQQAESEQQPTSENSAGGSEPERAGGASNSVDDAAAAAAAVASSPISCASEAQPDV